MYVVCPGEHIHWRLHRPKGSTDQDTTSGVYAVSVQQWPQAEGAGPLQEGDSPGRVRDMKICFQWWCLLCFCTFLLHQKKKVEENDGTFTQELPEVGRVDKNCAQPKVLLLFKIRSKSQSKVLTETTWVESNKKEIKPREKVYLMLCLVVGMTRIFSTADGLPRIKARQRREHTPVLISSETINHHRLFR